MLISNLVNVRAVLKQAKHSLSGDRSITPSTLNLGARRGWVNNAKLRLLYSPGKDLPVILQEAVWVSEPVWMGPENLALSGVQTRGVR
jgi:hypothetical protein